MEGLTGERLSGDLLTAVIWSWFAATESHSRLSQRAAGMVENPGLSYGLFHAVAQPVYSWGVVRQVRFPGLNIDIGHIRNVGWAKDNDDKTWVNYNRLRGQYMSALEHSVPERVFSDENLCNLSGSTSPRIGLPECPNAVSAVKILKVAASQGQRIYAINRIIYAKNPDVVDVVLKKQSYDVQSRVQQALDAGQEVTVHEMPIKEFGWAGAGYIVFDPHTGAGAYRIEGGSNGGELTAEELNRIVNFQGLSLGIGLTSAILAMLLIAGSALLAPAALLMIPVLAIVAAAVFASMLTFLLIDSDGDARGCVFQGISVTIKIFLGKILINLGAGSRFGAPTVIEKILGLLGVGYEAADPFIPDTPIQNCLP